MDLRGRRGTLTHAAATTKLGTMASLVSIDVLKSTVVMAYRMSCLPSGQQRVLRGVCRATRWILLPSPRTLRVVV